MVHLSPKKGSLLSIYTLYTTIASTRNCLVILLVIRWLAACVASWNGGEEIADDFLEGGQRVHSLTEDDRELDRDEEADGGEVD